MENEEPTTVREWVATPDIEPQGWLEKIRSWLTHLTAPAQTEQKVRFRKASTLFDQELIETLDALVRVDSLMASGEPSSETMRALAVMGESIAAMPSRFIAVKALRAACSHVLAGSPMPEPVPAMDSPTDDETSCALIVDEARALGWSSRLLPVHENLPGAVADALNVAIAAGIRAMHETRKEADEIESALGGADSMGKSSGSRRL